MQVSPQGQEANQEKLKGATNPDFSDKKHQGPEQQQRTRSQSNRHQVFSFHGDSGRSKAKKTAFSDR
jgi:hypothetical protein